MTANPTAPFTDQVRLRSAILNVLQSAHAGRDSAITHERLTAYLAAHGFSSITERAVRQAIEDMRNQDGDGALICAASGLGVYFAQSLNEVNEFTERELRSRARSLLQTARRQRREAARKFGGQARLF